MPWNWKHNHTFSSWWFQPIPKMLVKLDHFPQVGVKIKHIWNHHLVFFWVVVFWFVMFFVVFFFAAFLASCLFCFGLFGGKQTYQSIQSYHLEHFGKIFWDFLDLGHPRSEKIHQKYCWWLKSQTTTWDVWNPINNGKNYLSLNWLAGFQPSTVVKHKLWRSILAVFFWGGGAKGCFLSSKTLCCAMANRRGSPSSI